MTIKTDQRMTLLDFLNTKRPDGSQETDTVELMQEYAPVLADAPVFPANANYGHTTTFRRRLPSVGTAKINKGVVRSKSDADQRKDPIGMFAGRSEIDSRIQKVEGTAAFLQKRRDEDAQFEEAFAQLFMQNVLYGNTALDEASFDGLAIRLDDINAGADMKASQVWDHSASQAVVGNDACSIYVVDWGERGAHLIHPPNTVGGLDVQDKGEQPLTDDDGADMFGFVTVYDWFVGLAVKDPRHIARLANIDVSDAALDAPGQGLLMDNLEEIMSFMPDPGPTQRVLYCPFKLYSAFNKQARSKSNLALSIEDYLGKPTPHFHGYPLRRVERASITESAVV